MPDTDQAAVDRLEGTSPGAGETDERRPQDVGRKHRRQGAPSPATRLLLADYQEAMRSELRQVLGELAPVDPDPGLGLVKAEPKRPALEIRMRLWDLAIKLGRELGAEIDPGPVPGAVGPGQPTPPRRRGRIDYGGR